MNIEFKDAARCAQGFIREFFDQNPLSHLGLIVLRNGIAEKLTDLSGSPARCPLTTALRLCNQVLLETC